MLTIHCLLALLLQERSSFYRHFILETLVHIKPESTIQHILLLSFNCRGCIHDVLDSIVNVVYLMNNLVGQCRVVNNKRLIHAVASHSSLRLTTENTSLLLLFLG
jgi:hypothetical protein